VREFAALLDRFRPDVVHAHELFPMVSPWILPLCTRRGVPVVMTCVDYRLTCPVVTHLRDGQICTRCTSGQLFWAALGNCRQNWAESVTMAMYGTMVRSFGLYMKHVGQLIAPSEFTRAWLVQHLGVSADRVTAIAPVVDVPATATESLDGDYVAFAGRFAPEKGIHTFLEAARLAGVPVKLSRNEQSLVTTDLPPDAAIVVTRGRDDLARFYRGARFVVVPSVWFETFGLVGAEAMSHGVPVVASRIGALAELVDDGVDGLQFEPGRADDLADKMRRLWASPELRRRLGSAAREKVVRLWSADRHFEQTNALYERQLQRARHQREPLRAIHDSTETRRGAQERVTERS
jgi:glycosyltransferase involved in cell wall biosynthesis